MTIDLDKLEALAKAVAAGPAAQKHADPVMKNMGRLEFAETYKAYATALAPANVLTLIAEMRALREDKARLDWLQSFVDKEGRASISRIGGAYGIFNSESVASGFSMHEAIDAARKG